MCAAASHLAHAPALPRPADPLALLPQWGYRFVAWCAPPAGWCRLAELLMADSKDAERLCRLLLARAPPLRAFAQGDMVEIALRAAAENAAAAPRAVAVLKLGGGRPSLAAVDMLLRPAADGVSPWVQP